MVCLPALIATLAKRARKLQRWRHTFESNLRRKCEFRTKPRLRERLIGPGSVAERCDYRRTSQLRNNGPDRRSGRATLLI